MKYDIVIIPVCETDKRANTAIVLPHGKSYGIELQNVHVFTEDEFNSLRSLNIYEEKTVGDKWCYKCQPKGEQIIIVVDEDKEACYGKLLIELHNRNILKSKSL